MSYTNSIGVGFSYTVSHLPVPQDTLKQPYPLQISPLPHVMRGIFAQNRALCLAVANLSALTVVSTVILDRLSLLVARDTSSSSITPRVIPITS